ncbi:MAG: hypothetical protein RL148_2265 [Planctomycetota bacterium]
MKVKDVMTRQPHTCRPEDTLAVAAQLMWEHDCGCVPVVDEHHHVVGIVTDRDACMASYTKGLRLDEIPVRAAMAKHVFTCGEDETTVSAKAQLQAHQVRRLPVVDETGRLTGILSVNDLLRSVAATRQPELRLAGADRLVGALAAVGAPRLLVAPVEAPSGIECEMGVCDEPVECTSTAGAVEWKNVVLPVTAKVTSSPSKTAKARKAPKSGAKTPGGRARSRKAAR